jgi:catechol 2,3-dioxygenase-like lactoylglutathione lyase family enzyme
VPARAIHHVDLAVEDVERSIAFYMTLLGPLGGYYEVGIEHFAITVDTREELDQAYEQCVELGARVQYSPGGPRHSRLLGVLGLRPRRLSP